MDKAARDSIAALWEVLWTVPDGGDDPHGQVAKVMMTMGAMKAVMMSAGVDHSHVAEWIRSDKVDIGTLEDVEVSNSEEREEFRKLTEHILFGGKHYALKQNERAFIKDMHERLGEGKNPTPKQRHWLVAIAEKHIGYKP